VRRISFLFVCLSSPFFPLFADESSVVCIAAFSMPQSAVHSWPTLHVQTASPRCHTNASIPIDYR
jgi:hypothetical protein